MKIFMVQDNGVWLQLSITLLRRNVFVPFVEAIKIEHNAFVHAFSCVLIGKKPCVLLDEDFR